MVGLINRTGVLIGRRNLDTDRHRGKMATTSHRERPGTVSSQPSEETDWHFDFRLLAV